MRPCDGPEGVNRVQRADRSAEVSRGAYEEPAEYREGGSHECRGYQQQQAAEGKPDGREHLRHVLKVAVEQAIQGLIRGDQPGQHQAVSGDGKLDYAEDDEWPASLVRESPPEIASQGQPAHEGCQDGGDGVCGVAHHQPKQPRPENLVNQAATAGNEEQHEHGGPEGLPAAGAQGVRCHGCMFRHPASPDPLLSASGIVQCDFNSGFGRSYGFHRSVMVRGVWPRRGIRSGRYLCGICLPTWHIVYFRYFRRRGTEREKCHGADEETKSDGGGTRARGSLPGGRQAAS